MDIFKICKVETVGDAYICAAGGKPLNDHADMLPVMRCACCMLRYVRRWTRHDLRALRPAAEIRRNSEAGIRMNGGTRIEVGKTSFEVDCRIGIHCGEAVGAIVGFVMQRYHLFGQSLNVG